LGSKEIRMNNVKLNGSIESYLVWTYNNGNYIVFKSVNDVFHFLSGVMFCYGHLEKINDKEKIFIEDLDNYITNELKIGDEFSGINYSYYIINHLQKDNNNGLSIFYNLFFQFISKVCTK
jgi:hypothetical protein